MPLSGPCGRCRKRGWGPDQSRSAHELGTSIRAAIHRLKYGRSPEIAHRLATLFDPGVFDAPDWDVVVAVPLHRWTRWRRGYNQAGLLATSIADRLRRPIGPGLLMRTRKTASQAQLSATARRANVRGAFAARRPGGIRGRRILLVDDVITTGATMHACAGTLREAGAVRVDGWSVARGVL